MTRIKTFSDGGSLTPGDLNAVEDYIDAQIATLSGDPRLPSQGENDALQGTAGTPSASNRYVTASDVLYAGPRVVIGEGTYGAGISNVGPPGVTGGFPFTVAHAGLYMLSVDIVGCYSGSTGFRTVRQYINGLSLGTRNFGSDANKRNTPPTIRGMSVLPAGTNWIWTQQFGDVGGDSYTVCLITAIQQGTY